MMRRPFVSVLNQVDITDIQEASLWVLNKVGVRIEHRMCLSILESAGADVDRNTLIVKFPTDLIYNQLSNIPKTVVLASYARDDDLELSDECQPYARPAIGMDTIFDDSSEERRNASLSELEAWVKIIEALENIHIVAPLYPRDVPQEIRDVQAVETSLRYSHKPVVICAYSRASLEWMATLVSVLPRGLVPRIAVVISVDSPLTYSQNQLDIMLAAVQNGFPIILNSAGLAGATCPVTMRGCLVQMNAEALAGLALIQLVSPGAACIYDMQPLVFDMRVGNAAFGYAELGLLNSAFIELGRSYHLPTESSGLKTDSHLCDVQTGIEKVETAYLSVLAGANIISGAGSLSTSSMACLQQLVIDNDIFAHIRRVSQGISQENIDVIKDVIARVGPGGHYLADSHTLQNHRREYFLSKLPVRGTWESWQASGAKGIASNAYERVLALLESQRVPVLSPTEDNEFKRIMRKAQDDLMN